MTNLAERSFTLRSLIAAYPGATWRDRAHMAVRWRLCPLPALARCVPAEGTIVDLGCGHALFAQLLARQSARRSLIGVDLDGAKIALAQRLNLPNLRCLAGDITTLPLPPARAVTLLDVLYLVPYAAQERLLAGCAEELAPDGLILLKEMAERPRWKFALNWLEETLAVRLLRLTRSVDAGRFYFRARAGWEALLARLGFAVETIPLDHGYYHPHVVFIARRDRHALADR